MISSLYRLSFPKRYSFSKIPNLATHRPKLLRTRTLAVPLDCKDVADATEFVVKTLEEVQLLRFQVCLGFILIVLLRNEKF
jgi:hypothetical protein